MKDLSHFWSLSSEEQEQIRAASPGYADTEEDYQTFLRALFPAHESFEGADAIYHLSDTHTEGQAK